MHHYGDMVFLCPSTQTGNPYWFPEQLQAALPALHWLLLIPQMSYLIVLLPVCSFNLAYPYQSTKVSRFSSLKQIKTGRKQKK